MQQGFWDKCGSKGRYTWMFFGLPWRKISSSPFCLYPSHSFFFYSYKLSLVHWRSWKKITVIGIVYIKLQDSVPWPSARTLQVATSSGQEWTDLALGLIFETKSVRHIVCCSSFHSRLATSSSFQLNCPIYCVNLVLSKISNSAGCWPILTTNSPCRHFIQDLVEVNSPFKNNRPWCNRSIYSW